MLTHIHQPTAAVIEIACRPWGQPAVLVLFLPAAATERLVALWAPPWGGLYVVEIGRA